MSTADEDRITLRQEQVIELRRKGGTIRAIAKQLGISVGLAHKDLATVMQETCDKTRAQADIERGVSLERIDQGISLCMRMLDEGDASSIDKLVKLEDRRAKLLGLDAPVKQELDAKISGSATPAEAARLVREAFGDKVISSDEPSEPEPVSEDTSAD